ncbi:MAG: ChaN family lipoprotein [Thiobacillaceae bacterium]
MTLLPMAGCASEAAPQIEACGRAGSWLSHDGQQLRPADARALLARLADQQVVLLGENHDSAEDHRWQLHTLAQIHAFKPSLAIGFEMFPRRLQPVLDRWVAGELSEAEFLRLTDWDRVWGYDARMYLPLFHYARMHRIPMLALNVERELVAAVDAKGWDAVPAAQREGLTRPAAPAPAYIEQLRRVFAQHPEKRQDEAAFARFVEAQVTWDRAMAQAIAAHLTRQPDALVVGILGAGHVRHGHGVAHQLEDLGIKRVANLLTWEADGRCEGLTAGLADAIYLVRAPQSDPPRLGIAMESVAGGIRIAQVTAGSVAERAGLKVGDVVAEAAGVAIRTPLALRQTVERQAPGTWLPLKVRRDGQELEIVARFPPAR